MLTIKGKIGSFPVPKAARVGENMSGGSSLLVVFGSVAPADVARFYATALPQAGFTVTSNSLVSQGAQKGAIIQFTGHGFKGNIESVAQFPGASIAGLGATNVTTIVMSANRSLVANFVQRVVLTVNAGTGGSASGGGTCWSAASVTGR